MNIGDVFIFGRLQYTVVAKFVDLGKEYIVARKMRKDGIYTYSNIFTYTENGKLFMHV